MPTEFSKSPHEFADTFERVARRYQGCGRFAQGYVAGKLRRDPVHRDVLALAAQQPFGDVVDIGCGRGQLGVALLEAGLATSVRGFDCHAGHLAQARRAASGLALSATIQDLAATQHVPAASTVLLIDVLYQLDAGVQLALLRAATRAARERILIRTLDPDQGMRSAWTLQFERLTRWISPHAGACVEALPVTRLAATLADAGFAISVVPCRQGTPFANVLIIGRRAGRQVRRTTGRC